MVAEEQLNVTPNFYTYDATKIKVGQMPQGYVGLPVDFDSELVFMFLHLLNFLLRARLDFIDPSCQAQQRALMSLIEPTKHTDSSHTMLLFNCSI